MTESCIFSLMVWTGCCLILTLALMDMVYVLRWWLPLNIIYDHPSPLLSCSFTVICGHGSGRGNISTAFFTYRQLIYQSFSLWPVEIRQREREIIVYDSWAAATETVSLFGCAGQQSDNGWRGLLEPAVPLGFVNAVRGGWCGSSAFISTFRDTHSCWPVDLSLSLICSLHCLAFYSELPLTVHPCVLYSLLYPSLFLPPFLRALEWIHFVLLL